VAGEGAEEREGGGGEVGHGRGSRFKVQGSRRGARFELLDEEYQRTGSGRMGARF
jgi:hypothetical protein